MKRFKRIVMAAFAVAIVGASAFSAVPVAAVSSSALSIAPKKNYIVEPGKSVDDTLTIRNLDENAELSLTLRVVDFSFTGDTGTPKLFLDENAPQTTWSLKPFLTIPKTVTVAPGSSKTVDMSVAVPAGHGAGSFYSAIVYSSGSGDQGGNVGLSASGVTLVFVSIPGKVTEDLKIEKFGLYNKATSTDEAGYQFVSTQEPDTIGYTLKNSGNVVESPVGSIKLKDMWGHSYDVANVNPSGSLALIGQSRTFTTCIKLKKEDVNFNGEKTQANTCTSPGMWPGFYTATLDIFYGQNGNNTQEITKTTIFWYLPWWFIALVVIGLGIVAYYIRKIVRAVRIMRNRPKKSADK